MEEKRKKKAAPLTPVKDVPVKKWGKPAGAFRFPPPFRNPERGNSGFIPPIKKHWRRPGKQARKSGCGCRDC